MIHTIMWSILPSVTLLIGMVLVIGFSNAMSMTLLQSIGYAEDLFFGFP